MNENDILMEALGLTSDDLRAIDPERAEAELESGGVVPKGIYHAQCVGVSKRDSKSSDAEGYEFEFEILAGPFRGSKVKDTLWKSDKQSGRNRMTIFGKRMGLLIEVDNGGKKHLQLATGMSGWPDVRGWSGLIEIDVEEYALTDKVTKQPTGKKGHANRLTFAGILQDGDPKGKDIARGTPANIGMLPRGSTTPATPVNGANGHPSGAGSHAGQVADPYAAAGI
jgi:hypothetical protein